MAFVSIPVDTRMSRWLTDDMEVISFLPDTSFEVDGILYVPPWTLPDYWTESRRNPGPMLMFKEDHPEFCAGCGELG